MWKASFKPVVRAGILALLVVLLGLAPATTYGASTDPATVPDATGVGVNPTTDRVYVANFDSDTISVIATPLTCNGLAVTIVGTPSDDVIMGTAGDDVIHGLGGNDTIDGLGGDDVICGGKGNDTLVGGPGKDTANYSGAAGPIMASLILGVAVGEGLDTLATIENLTGSPYNDSLIGNSGPNLLMGGGQ